MKALVIKQPGKWEIIEQDIPQPGKGEALVRVKAAELNRYDLYRLNNKSGQPFIPGMVASGSIEQLGDEAEGFEVGQRVVIWPFFPFDPDNTASPETQRITGKVLGRDLEGTLREFLAVPTNNLVELPEGLSFEEGCAQAYSAPAAWNALVNRAGMSPGELVLVHRAGSGSGSAAVQVAGVWGGKVIACDDSEQNLEKAIASGADYAINYRERDFYEQVLELSNGRGADMVVEQQGNNTWERSLNCVARNGRLVVVGFGAAEKVNLDLQTLISQQLIVIGSFGYSKDDLKEVLRLTEEGRMQAVVDNVYTLEESGAAFARLDSRDRFGKVLIKF